MKLRRYWQVVRRRLWLIGLILVVTAVVSVLTARPAPIRYGATMRYVVGVIPQEPADGSYGYDRYYTWLASEYLMDDLAEVVRGRVFAEEVSRRLAEMGHPIPPEAIVGNIGASTKHRILSVHLTWHDPDELSLIAQAVDFLLRDVDVGRYFPQLGERKARLELIDPAMPYPVGPGLRRKLDIPLRLVIALVAGVALAFVLEWFDDTVRHRDELAEMGLTVLAETPREGKFPARLFRR